jgi:predicted cupin superfamily sugar epimerase
MLSAKDLIKRLNLTSLPLEGGYYSETWRSDKRIAQNALPDRYKADKSFGTAIYYLLTLDTRSMLHRLPTDEIYHFYLGDPVRMLLLSENGKGETITLGSDIEAGQHVQFVVPRGIWQGSYLIEGGRFALMGTTMFPGFDFTDYEPGDPGILSKAYPHCTDLINRLCD